MSFEDSGLDLEEYFGCSDIHATRPEYVARPSIPDSRPSLDDLEKYKEKLADFEKYKKDDALWLGEYNDKISQRNNEFFQYFCGYVEIPLDHPKATALFSKCEERGHSGGYSEIINVGLDLVELVV